MRAGHRLVVRESLVIVIFKKRLYMEYYNFLIGLITASSIVFALVIYIITQTKERKGLLQKEYDDYGSVLTKFCRLCYFVCHDSAFFDYEKRIKNQRIT